MLPDIGLALAAVAVIVAVTLAAGRTGVPTPVYLVVAGSVYALLPGPNLQLQPSLVLDVIVPPLLYGAAIRASLFDIRANRRAVLSLSVLLVVAATFAVGGAVSAAGATVPFAAACVLGAAVSPTDPIATLAIAGRVGLPARLVTLMEGEGLLNDATSLTLFGVALSAVAGHASLASAGGLFVAEAVGGAAVGFAVAFVLRQGQRFLRDPVIEGVVSLATPFLAYLPAQAAHTSGVLAVVVCGLWLGHHSPATQSGRSRLQNRSVWRLIEILLQGFVFLLIGEQLPRVVRGIEQYPTSTVVLVGVAAVGTVLVIRPIWLLLGARGPGRWARLSLDEPGGRPLLLRELVVLAWGGTRGVITLAAAFSIPLMVDGHPFPERPLLVFCAYLVVLVTLLGQGLTLGPIARRLRLPTDEAEELRRLARARAATVDAGLRRLDELLELQDEPDQVVESLRRASGERRQRSEDHLAGPTTDDGTETPTAVRARLRRAMIGAEREELLRWRDTGRLPDRSLRVLENELDHEERLLPP